MYVLKCTVGVGMHIFKFDFNPLILLVCRILIFRSVAFNRIFRLITETAKECYEIFDNIYGTFERANLW